MIQVDSTSNGQIPSLVVDFRCMPLSLHTEKDPNGVDSAPNASLVREQLRRILAHPLFTNSKRYPVLLAFTVEQTLQGNASDLRERTIGVEAFGREPDYDVSLDPVVRTTAAEVRKRLIQYYYNPEHAGELLIELPLGSYVPSFREPASAHPGPVAALAPPPEPETDASHPAEQAPISARKSSPARIVLWTAAIAAGLVLAGYIGFRAGRYQPPSQPTNMERFWEPVTLASVRVTYCLGVPEDPIDRQRRTSEDYPVGKLNVSDVISLARSIAPLVPRNRAFRVVTAPDIGFSQLREGPIVLIGAFSNAWTLRIAQDLPIGFEYDGEVRNIVDRKTRPRKAWSFEWQVPNTRLAKDYAVVARIHDRVTGQPVILLAGILAEGTEAAGEVASNPEYLNAMLQKAPKNWDQLNLEAVIETQVIDGNPGPPIVLDVETW